MLSVISNMSPLFLAASSSTKTISPDEAAAVGAAAGGMMVFFTVFSIIMLAVAVVCIIGMWKVFEKAGEDGWKAIIPFYNVYIITKICWQTKFFWFFLAGCFCCAPVGVVIACITYYKLGKAFGKSSGFCVGLILLSPIFLCLLGFGNDKYLGNPDNTQNPPNGPMPPNGPVPPMGGQPGGFPTQQPQGMNQPPMGNSQMQQNSMPNQQPVPGTPVPPVGQPPVGQPPAGQPPVPPAPQGGPQPPIQNF